jgi:CDP-diacylglycerol--glycerol-3-phosphate 3-phosphatidyltransferase
MKQLPNILTGLRLVLSILMFAALVAIRAGILGAPMSPQLAVFLLWFALAAFIIAAITDYLDGWLARRWQVVSVLGAILDPIADKILVCGAILGLIGVGMSPDVVAFSGIILFREFAVSALREVLAPRGIKLPVTFLAKLKTSLQLVSIGALMVMKFWPAWGINARIDHQRTAMEAAELLYGLAAAVTLWTGLEYGRSAWLALQAQPEE